MKSTGHKYWRGITVSYLARMVGGRDSVNDEVSTVASQLIDLGMAGDPHDVLMFAEAVDPSRLNDSIVYGDYTGLEALDTMVAEILAHMADTDRVVDAFSFQTE